MALVAPGCEISRGAAGALVARHHHIRPYAALVLSGGYVEAGDRGRFRAQPGDVLVHGGFEAHQDRFGPSGAAILNLPLSAAPAWSFGRTTDPDSVVRTAERDPVAAALLLIETSAAGRGLEDWPDLLAEALRKGRRERLEHWASMLGLRPQSLSRGFRLAYGISPRRYRLEVRAGQAARLAVKDRASLAEVAVASGFADQPHMTRTMCGVFGAAPQALRRNVQYVQYEREAAS